jgi:hypothetical protein
MIIPRTKDARMTTENDTVVESGGKRQKRPAPGTKLSRAAALAVAKSISDRELGAGKTKIGKVVQTWHPACQLLPRMTKDEYDDLLEDIRNNGQRHPIIVDEAGKGLDGRHRYWAVKELRLVPKIEVFVGDETAKIKLIISENMRRRHLTKQQRAAVAAELASELGAAAHQRQLAGTLASPEAKGKSAAQAAKLIGDVSVATVERAIRRMHTDPQAHGQAKAGTLAKARPTKSKSESRRPPSRRSLRRW